MKKTIRIIAVMLLMALAVCCFSACDGSLASTPSGMNESVRGDRAEFSESKLQSITANVSSDLESNSLTFSVSTVGYSGLDYLNCELSVTVYCTVLYEDMTEEDFVRTIILSLPYSGTADKTLTVNLTKPAHNVYEAPSEIIIRGGQVIKK